MAHVARGDTVVVTKGREKGKRGKVKRVLGNGRDRDREDHDGQAPHPAVAEEPAGRDHRHRGLGGGCQRGAVVRQVRRGTPGPRRHRRRPARRCACASSAAARSPSRACSGAKERLSWLTRKRSKRRVAARPGKGGGKGKAGAGKGDKGKAAKGKAGGEVVKYKREQPPRLKTAVRRAKSGQSSWTSSTTATPCRSRGWSRSAQHGPGRRPSQNPKILDSADRRAAGHHRAGAGGDPWPRRTSRPSSCARATRSASW